MMNKDSLLRYELSCCFEKSVMKPTDPTGENITVLKKGDEFSPQKVVVPFEISGRIKSNKIPLTLRYTYKSLKSFKAGNHHLQLKG